MTLIHHLYCVYSSVTKAEITLSLHCAQYELHILLKTNHSVPLFAMIVVCWVS